MITSWKELPIGKFQKIVGINELDVDDDTKTFMTVALLNDMEYEEFISLPLAKASSLVAASSFLYDEPKKVKVRRTYEIGGMTFRMMRNVMDLTTAQYIDYQGIVRLGMEKSLPSMMAIVLIPEGHNYNEGYDMDEVREILTDNLNVEDAFAIADFFLESVREVNSSSSPALGRNDGHSGDTGSPQAQGGDESPKVGDEADNGGTPLRVWLSLLEAVREMTGYNFGQLYLLPALEFFAYVSYIRWKQAKEERQLREFRIKNHIK